MINNKDLVTVIIPCFNAVEYTKQCVDSILKNTAYNYELILINNGSADGTKKYLESLKKKIKPHEKLKKLTVVQLNKNLGVAKALNLGISKSIGKYVCYLNSDVIVTKNWLNKMLKACNKNIKNAAVGTLFNAFDDKHFIEEIQRNKLKIEKISNVISILNKGIVEKAKTIHGLCILIKKNVFKKVGLFNEKFYPCFGEDIEFCERLKTNGYNIVDAKDVFIFHYWNKSSQTTEFKKKYKNIQKIKEEQYKQGIPRKYKI